MALSNDHPPKRSLLTLALVCLVPSVASGAFGAMAYGGTRAATFGIIWGLAVGVLAVGFALFIGRLSHRV
jgi:uncharacterized protein YqgC (DUF456 family)